MKPVKRMIGRLLALAAAGLLLCAPMGAAADPGAPYEANVYDMLEDGSIEAVDTLWTDSEYTVEGYMTPLPGTPWATRFPASGQIELMQVAYTRDGEARTGWVICNPENLLGEEGTSGAANTGFVLCASLSLRESPATSAAVIRTLEYGETFQILSESDGWYRVSAEGGGARREGYVKADYVLVEPAYFTSTGETAVYAYPAQEAPRIALLSGGEQHPIIAQLDGYTVISLRGASGFVRN